MDCVFLGTGYSINTPQRHNTSLFLRKGQTGLMIDCNGMGIRRLHEVGYVFEDMEHIFLTHEHVDHIGAIGNIINQIWLKSCYYRPENRRTKPLNIYANVRTMKAVQGLLSALGIPQSPHMIPLEFHELPDAGGTLTIENIDLTYFQVNHNGTPCFGLAAHGDKRNLVYSADTEPLPSIYDHLKLGDILIHECNSIDDAVNVGHTTWQQMQQFLPSLPAVDVYLVHLPPMTDKQETSFKVSLSQSCEGRVHMGEDGLVVKL